MTRKWHRMTRKWHKRSRKAPNMTINQHGMTRQWHKVTIKRLKMTRKWHKMSAMLPSGPPRNQSDEAFAGRLVSFSLRGRGQLWWRCVSRSDELIIFTSSSFIRNQTVINPLDAHQRRDAGQRGEWKRCLMFLELEAARLETRFKHRFSSRKTGSALSELVWL